MTGAVRRFLLTACLLLLAVAGLPGAPAVALELSEAPPAHYLRKVVIRVTDIKGRPLPGVRAAVEPGWGLLRGEPDLVSDNDGRISFCFEPVVENKVSGVLVRDLFLDYHLSFRFCLIKDGCLPFCRQVSDRQEYAGFSDPLYKGLNRRPAETPLLLPVTLAAYEDFLVRPAAPEVQPLKPLLTALSHHGLEYGLAPGSVDLTSQDWLIWGLEYRPLFDQTEMGLLDAGACLLLGPVKDSLKIMVDSVGLAPQVKTYQVTVFTAFQDRATPHTMPEEHTFVFRLASAAVVRIVDWTPDRPFLVNDIEATVGRRLLNLKEALPAAAILAGPGSDDPGGCR